MATEMTSNEDDPRTDGLRVELTSDLITVSVPVGLLKSRTMIEGGTEVLSAYLLTLSDEEHLALRRLSYTLLSCLPAGPPV